MLHVKHFWECLDVWDWQDGQVMYMIWEHFGEIREEPGLNLWRINKFVNQQDPYIWWSTDVFETHFGLSSTYVFDEGLTGPTSLVIFAIKAQIPWFGLLGYGYAKHP